jgi:hypothetical protein
MRIPSFNYDLLNQYFTEPVERPFVTHKAILGTVYGLPNMSNPEDVLENDIWVDWLRDYVPPDEDPSEPNSEFYYPIFDTVGGGLNENGTDRRVVGLLWLGFFWRDMLTDLLPQDSVGIDVVVSNPCSASFTYRLDGQRPTFMGSGDLHEAQFDRYGTNSTLIGLRQFSFSKSSYTGVPVDEEFCPVLITVYPSSATLSAYTTTNRIVFTVCSVLIFAFTSIVFILYDKSVERRQNKVMKTAVRAETIVQSLFPAVVRDRIYPTTDVKSSGNSKAPKSEFNVANSKARIQSFLGGDGDNDDMIEGGDMTASPPVADLFPECTVMFTDIVGKFESEMMNWCHRNCHSRCEASNACSPHPFLCRVHVVVERPRAGAGVHAAGNDLRRVRCHRPPPRRVQGRDDRGLVRGRDWVAGPPTRPRGGDCPVRARLPGADGRGDAATGQDLGSRHEHFEGTVHSVASYIVFSFLLQSTLTVHCACSFGSA